MKNNSLLSRFYLLSILVFTFVFSQENPPSFNISNQTDQAKLQRPIQFIYGFDFDFLLDNLEESQKIWPTRTLFAGSLFPHIGVHFYNQNLNLGGYFINNMGENYPMKGGITLSYDFTYNDIKGYFGIFSKKTG
ncbi:hypothetical protein [Helicobacter sp. 'CLO3_human']|uniref:hypothetical protein n=1 Tax=Helicobacter sp. 'CLO3_human' TaxID=2020249 RepID=UPI0013151DCB|nr:hypothetical protein [Helicobacter sp. 'CLO3_human']